MSLQLRYRLNEGTGTIAYDTSGNSRNGSLVNFVSSDWQIPGLSTSSGINGSLYFSANNKYVSIPDFALGTTFQFSCWFKPNQSGNFSGYIFNKYVDSNNFIRIYATQNTGNSQIPVTLNVKSNGISALVSTTLPLTNGVCGKITAIRNGDVFSIGLNNSFQTVTVSGIGTGYDDVGAVTTLGHVDGINTEISYLDNCEIWDSVPNSSTNDKLLGYYKFDENTGTECADESGNNVPLVLYNGVSWVPGVIRSAMSADGVNDYGSVYYPNGGGAAYPSLSGYNRTLDFSFSCWFKKNNRTKVSGNLFGLADASAYFDRCLGWSTKGIFRFAYSGGILSYTAWNNNVIDLTNWHHVVVTAEGIANGWTKIYADGTLVASHQHTSVLGSDTSTPILNLGGVYDNAANVAWYYGGIDQVRVYQRVLSQADVTNLFNEPQQYLLCWNYKARYKNSSRMYYANGSGKYPSELKVPASVDVSTGMMIDEGKVIANNQFKVIQ